MNGEVELVVASLELERAEAGAVSAVRVRAVSSTNEDVVSVAVLLTDAPAIGARVRVRIDQVDDPAPGEVNGG